MSILIKGMDMPKACYYCQFLWFKTPDEEGGEGMCDLLEKWVAEVCDRPDWCPLEEVTEDDMK